MASESGSGENSRIVRASFSPLVQLPMGFVFGYVLTGRIEAAVVLGIATMFAGLYAMHGEDMPFVNGDLDAE